MGGSRRHGGGGVEGWRSAGREGVKEGDGSEVICIKGTRTVVVVVVVVVVCYTHTHAHTYVHTHTYTPTHTHTRTCPMKAG